MLQHPHPMMYKRGLKEDQEGRRWEEIKIKLQTLSFFSLHSDSPSISSPVVSFLTDCLSIFMIVLQFFSFFIHRKCNHIFFHLIVWLWIEKTEKKLDSRDWTWIWFAVILVSYVSFCLHRSKEDSERLWGRDRRYASKGDRTISRQTWSCRHL